MLRTYLYKNVFVHACHQLLGLVIAIAFIYVHYTGLIGLKPQYDISHSVNDAISFLAIFLVMLLVGFQFLKGYLLYFSSAKQVKTRENRIEKYIKKILAGKGLED